MYKVEFIFFVYTLLNEDEIELIKKDRFGTGSTVQNVVVELI